MYGFSEQNFDVTNYSSVISSTLCWVKNTRVETCFTYCKFGWYWCNCWPVLPARKAFVSQVIRLIKKPNLYVGFSAYNATAVELKVHSQMRKRWLYRSWATLIYCDQVLPGGQSTALVVDNRQPSALPYVIKKNRKKWKKPRNFITSC